MPHPEGGPKFFPPRLSSSPSIVDWNIPAVVADEKLIRFTSMESFLRVSKYMRAVVVFAVPLPPTISTGCLCFCWW